jgi:HlyD family secretion protein
MPQTGFRIVAAAFLSLLVVRAAPGQPQMTRLAVVPAVEEEVPETITVVGTVRPMRRSVLGSEIAGLVKELRVEEGDRVEAGALICQLRDTTARLALDEARETVSQLEAALAELEAGTREEDVRSAKAAAEEAKALWENWKYERERIAGLERENAASPKEINDTIAELAAAEQRYRQAQAEYDKAVAGPRKEVIAQARFAVAAEGVKLQQLQDEFDKTTIEAPFTGFVTEKRTEVGEWIPLGGAVVELVELDAVLVRVMVPESAISFAKRGDPVRVRIDALRDVFTGTIKHIVPQADLAARTFPVEIEIPNPKYALKAGMFARATLPAGRTTKSIVVPKDALVNRAGNFMVVAAMPSPQGQGYMAMPVPVELGAEIGERVAVFAPQLRPGVPIAVRGQERVYGPSPAEIVPADQVGAAPGPGAKGGAPGAAPTSEAATTQPAGSKSPS